ncbi:MAG: hypothetical protein ACSLFL_00455, partial [Alphaproteobacteria bacterium]
GLILTPPQSSLIALRSTCKVSNKNTPVRRGIFLARANSHRCGLSRPLHTGISALPAILNALMNA